MAQSQRTSSGAAAQSGDVVSKGRLTDKFFMRVARHELNSDEHIQLGVFLGITRSVVRKKIHDSEGTVDSTFAILESWRNKLTGTTSNDMFEQLCAAYLELKKTDVAEYIRSQQVQYLINLLQKARKTTQTCRQKSNEQMRLVKDESRQSKEEVCRLRDTVRCQQEEIKATEEEVCLLKDTVKSQQEEMEAAEEEVCQLRDMVESQKEEMKATEEELRQLKDHVKRERSRRNAAEASTDNAHVTSPTCRPKQRLLVVGGVTNEKIGTGQREYNHCHYWMEESNCWQLLTELPQSVGRWYDICQLASDQLLLTGGVKGGVKKGDCWVLDGNKWTQMPSLASARYLHRNVLLGDYVYVVGGKDVSGKVIASVERFDLKQHQWSAVPDMPQPVYVPSVISYGHRVFVFGGRSADNAVLSCTQVYDTTSGKWITLAAMPEACDCGAAVSINSCIYLVGGHNRSCLRYDPYSHRWTRLSRPCQKYGQAPAVVWQGGILVAGGGIGKPESAIIEHYDPVTDKWSDWQTPLKEKLMCHGMFSVILSGV